MPKTEVLLASGQEYCLQVGKKGDRKVLLKMMQHAYQEQRPDASLEAIAETMEQLWSEHTPFWLVLEPHPQATADPLALGCLWIGAVLDPITGDRCPHVFLLYVDPQYRRRGLGRALMQHGETWAIAQGFRQLGLHVFVENVPAQSLYQDLGYGPQSVILQKTLR